MFTAAMAIPGLKREGVPSAASPRRWISPTRWDRPREPSPDSPFRRRKIFVAPADLRRSGIKGRVGLGGRSGPT